MIGLHVRKYLAKSHLYIEKVAHAILNSGHDLLLFPPILKHKARLSLPEGRVHAYSDELLASCEAVFCVGGDGTILEAVTYIRDQKVPLLGINTGKLGFLAYVSKDRIKEALSLYFSGKYHYEQRSLLRLNDPQSAFRGLNFALNEFVLLRKDLSSMIGISCYVDTHFVAKFWADGLMVATPTGSTAYSLSCGGSISVPSCEHFILTPINSHTLNARSLIVPDTSRLTFEVQSTSRRILVSLDSRSISMPSPSKFSIDKESFYIRLIQIEGTHFFNTLQEKMRWGVDIRNSSHQVL